MKLIILFSCVKKIFQNQPIGIFDSGIGGLTVAHAIKKLLPDENLIYFGDTAHLPYGDKSEDAIVSYSKKIVDFLLQKNCKLIVMACNSASAVAYSFIKNYVSKEIKVINVIDPVAEEVIGQFHDKVVGVIGTKVTIESGIYYKKINGINNIILKGLSTPLLVPMIESGWVNNQISYDIVKEYLDDESLKNIELLILGCTHYPLILPEIKRYYGNGTVQILDSPRLVALVVKNYLTQTNLLSTQINEPDQFFVSDFTPSFESSSKLFFHKEVSLQKHLF